MLRLSRFFKGVGTMGGFNENHLKHIAQQNSTNPKPRSKPKPQKMRYYGQRNKVVFASGSDQEKLKSNKEWQILIARTQLGNYSLYLRDFSEKSIRYPFYNRELQQSFPVKEVAIKKALDIANEFNLNSEFIQDFDNIIAQEYDRVNFRVILDDDLKGYTEFFKEFSDMGGCLCRKFKTDVLFVISKEMNESSENKRNHRDPKRPDLNRPDFPWTVQIFTIVEDYPDLLENYPWINSNKVLPDYPIRDVRLIRSPTKTTQHQQFRFFKDLTTAEYFCKRLLVAHRVFKFVDNFQDFDKKLGDIDRDLADVLDRIRIKSTDPEDAVVHLDMGLYGQFLESKFYLHVKAMKEFSKNELERDGAKLEDYIKMIEGTTILESWIIRKFISLKDWSLLNKNDPIENLNIIGGERKGPDGNYVFDPNLMTRISFDFTQNQPISILRYERDAGAEWDRFYNKITEDFEFLKLPKKPCDILISKTPDLDWFDWVNYNCPSVNESHMTATGRSFRKIGMVISKIKLFDDLENIPIKYLEKKMMEASQKQKKSKEQTDYFLYSLQCINFNNPRLNSKYQNTRLDTFKVPERVKLQMVNPENAKQDSHQLQSMVNFPIGWHGRHGGDLAKASGISGALAVNQTGTYGLAFDKKSALEMSIYCKGVRSVIGDDQFERYQALSEEKIKKMNKK